MQIKDFKMKEYFQMITDIFSFFHRKTNKKREKKVKKANLSTKEEHSSFFNRRPGRARLVLRFTFLVVVILLVLSVIHHGAEFPVIELARAFFVKFVESCGDLFIC